MNASQTYYPCRFLGNWSPMGGQNAWDINYSQVESRPRLVVVPLQPYLILLIIFGESIDGETHDYEATVTVGCWKPQESDVYGEVDVESYVRDGQVDVGGPPISTD